MISYPISAFGVEYTVTKPAPAGNPALVYVNGGRLDKDLSRGHPYEAKFLEYVQGLRLKGKIVDVGAHIGNHSLWFAAVCGLEVYAFEPDPEAFKWLEANIDENRLEGRIHAHRMALGAYSGKGKWRPGTPGRLDQMPGCSCAGHDDFLPISTLDSYMLQEVAGIKIDVEGAEYDVLEGAKETVFINKPIIWAEATTDPDRERISAQLDVLGYELTGVIRVSSPLGVWEPR